MSEALRLSSLALFAVGPVVAVLALICRGRKPSPRLSRIKGWRWCVPVLLLPVEWLPPPALIALRVGEIKAGWLPVRVVGLAVGLAGALLLVWASVLLGRLMIHEAAVREDHALIENGPFRFLRHPVYAGYLALLLGSGVASLNVCLWLLWPVSLLGICIQAASEEQLPGERFGRDYERCLRQTGRLVPRFWGRAAEPAAAADGGRHVGSATSQLTEAAAAAELYRSAAEGLPVAMSEEEWLRCSETNPMFAAMEPPTEAQLAEFNLACCRRIRHLITDDITLQALDALESAVDHATIPAEIAEAANQVDATSAYFNPASPLFDPSRNTNAAKAVAHAVCRSLPPGSFHYWADALDNARLVALYCQWAVGRAADPDPDADAEDYYSTKDDAEPGLMWLRQRAEQAEASAQCDLIRRLFTRRDERVSRQNAEPAAKPDRGGGK